MWASWEPQVPPTMWGTQSAVKKLGSGYHLGWIRVWGSRCTALFVFLVFSQRMQFLMIPLLGSPFKHQHRNKGPPFPAFLAGGSPHQHRAHTLTPWRRAPSSAPRNPAAEELVQAWRTMAEKTERPPQLTRRPQSWRGPGAWWCGGSRPPTPARTPHTPRRPGCSSRAMVGGRASRSEPSPAGCGDPPERRGALPAGAAPPPAHGPHWGLL